MLTPTPRTLLKIAKRWAFVPVLAIAVGCESDPAGQPISDEARGEALDQAALVLRSDDGIATAQLVEDLTAGAAVGLAGESAGLEMELAGELPDLRPAAPYTLSSRITRGERTRKNLDLRFAAMNKGGLAAPGDVLYEATTENPDGSVSTIRVVQDEPESVVLVTIDTEWPNGHLLLASTHDEILVDRGADLEDEADDVLLALESALAFKNGARLVRGFDERASGGLVDDARVDVVSTFTPRPNHPRLSAIVTELVVDLHAIADEQDDRFVSVRRETTFRETAHDGGRARIEESLAPSSPVAEGEEPCGGEASRSIHFAASSAVVEWTDAASLACEGTSTLSREIDFADGTRATLSISEDAQGVVTLSASDRDGASTQGSFDPNAGSFSVDTTYPQGSDPVARSIDGMSNADGSDWSLDETIEFADGFLEENHLEGQVDAEGKRLAGSHAGRDESVTFELTSNLDETIYGGSIQNDRGESLDFDVELLPDASRILDFVAENPTTRVEGHFEIGPDGCGSGTLYVTEDDASATIDVEFCDDQLSDDAGNVLSL